ncbi:hypothetical protein M899_2464 [Bacteriovorax sp. BSW11_IV]|uniref:hypothetical protein n=1 Tax=Bacteriovorax sp. BSW11_IV TaxID=1353529 RepID=UPI00038A1DE7|nr:hypothetical protein [Bacteriovorax sp. BSW11_IV]EQC44578.1 hypothetical protein M899_2464 [Bacteriovorax sp. BSW11_IV]
MKNNFTDITYYSIGALGVGAVILGGTVANGIFVGGMSTLGVALLLIKLKDSNPRIFYWILKHNIMSDLILSVLLVMLMGTSTVTAIISGASAALFCSAGLTYLSKLFVKNSESSQIVS